ncbi:MAG: large subunit ribosomal protein L19 [Candidatus Binatia bacterium]
MTGYEVQAKYADSCSRKERTSVNVIDRLEAEQTRTDHPAFRAGDTLRVHARIVEGEKERVQIFEGVCLRFAKGAVRSTFTVRKTSYGVGVERTFAFNSPRIDKIEIKSHGKVRRTRLYYLRELTGRAARIKERRVY